MFYKRNKTTNHTAIGRLQCQNASYVVMQRSKVVQNRVIQTCEINQCKAAPF